MIAFTNDREFQLLFREGIFILARMKITRTNQAVRALCAAAIAASVVLVVPAAFAQGNSMPSSAADKKAHAAFEKFWAADSPAAADKTIAEIEKSGVKFDDALRILKQGRTYSAQPSGVVLKMNRTADGIEHYYHVQLPANYDPAKKYQVRFQLHGGIGRRDDNKPRTNPNGGAPGVGVMEDGSDQFYVMPYAWASEAWWTDDQVQNIDAIVDALKRTYNVDENRVILSGNSDGGTGAYYIAMHETTPFASVTPLIGFIMVLSNEDVDDGKIFPNNLRNKPMFVVNGTDDELYPTAIVEPFTKHLIASGVSIDYHPQQGAHHNTMWWPDVRDIYRKFEADHPRDPNPAKLTWETADGTHNRAHWLVIDSLGTAGGESADMPDANLIPGARHEMMFRTAKNPGRVDLVRAGNTVTATTKGVTSFTLLLSPDVFDFSQPVKVVANGKEVFNGRVERNLHTLLKWAARDNDRTMLYGAELPVKLQK